MTFSWRRLVHGQSGFICVEQLPLSAVQEVIQAMAQDANRDRLQKLMAYACTHSWASAQALLARETWQSLIVQILQRHPTPDDLHHQLYALVSTLNKAAEYTLVANTLLGYLAPLYTAPDPTASEPDRPYLQVATALNQDGDALRIKKLLFCACHNHWQNDTTVLDGLAMADLVRQMRDLAPTPEALTASLDSVVVTLNRQQAYRAIALRVSQAFAGLYATEVEATRATQILEADEEDLTLTFCEPSDGLALPQPLSLPSTASPRPLTLAALARALPRVRLDTVELYDLRLEIIKYTCPLRAKVLLFSALRQQTDWANPDYTALKTLDLGGLLKEMFQTYKYLEQARPALMTTAQTLAPAAEYLQACGAILRAIAPWYEAGGLEAVPLPFDDAEQTERLSRTDQTQFRPEPTCFQSDSFPQSSFSLSSTSIQGGRSR
jgi:hypothetical protein